MNHFEAVSRILVHSVAFDKMSDISPTISDVGNPDPPAWSELSWLRSRRWGQEQGWRETSQVRQSSQDSTARPGLLATPESRELPSPSPGQQTGGAWSRDPSLASSGQLLALDCSLPDQEVISVPALSSVIFLSVVRSWHQENSTLYLHFSR